MSPSRRQLDALEACLDAPDGSVKAAAHCMGISYVAMLSLLHRLYGQLDVATLAQAVAVLYERDPEWRVRAA